MKNNVKELIDNEKLEKLAFALQHSNETCIKLYDKYKAHFKKFKDANSHTTANTASIVHNIKLIIKHINYLEDTLKEITGF